MAMPDCAPVSKFTPAPQAVLQLEEGKKWKGSKGGQFAAGLDFGVQIMNTFNTRNRVRVDDHWIGEEEKGD